MHSDVLLVIVIVGALAFDFTNGFTTPPAWSPPPSPRALSPHVAVFIAAVITKVVPAVVAPVTALPVGGSRSC